MITRSSERRFSTAAALTIVGVAWPTSVGTTPAPLADLLAGRLGIWNVHVLATIAVIGIVIIVRSLRLRQLVARRTSELERKNLELSRETANRELAIDALGNSRERLRLALEAAHMEAWDWDARSGELHVGLASQAVADLPRALDKALELVHPGDRDRIRAAVAAAMTAGGLVEEMRILGLDGAIRWQAIRATVFRDGSGRPTGMTGVSQDITERKRAEEELHRSEERYRELFENANDVVYTHDLDGNITSLNNATEQLLGYPRDEAMRLNIADFIAPDHVELAREMIDRKVAGDLSGTAYELDVITKDARRVTLEVNSRLIVQDGVIVGVQGIGRDVSERKRLEAQLRQAQKMEAVGQLAGGIAHDFNNLLTAIFGNTQLARLSLAPTDELQEHLAEIEHASRRAAALTRQLLVFSRRQRLERRTVQLDEILRDFLQMLSRIIGEDIDLELGGADHASAISADPAQVEQIVMNLAVNARDAMPKGGRLTVDVGDVELDEAFSRNHEGAKPGRYVRLRISDSGSGMEPATLQRIFEPFFTTKAVGRGTGLGLAVVYGIVKQHDAHIDVASEPGVGTTFSIYFPAVPAPAGSSSLPDAAPVRRGVETILVAEDEEALCKLTERLLTSLGYTVLLARDGEEAIATFARHRGEIDLVLLDVIMPRKGGREVYHEIRSAGSDVPVIFMTGYSAEMAPAALAKTGCQLIEKPYGIDRIGHLVREALDRRSARVLADAEA